MKNQFIFIISLLSGMTLLISCGTVRPASGSSDDLSSGKTRQTSGKSNNPVFINTISTGSSENNSAITTSGETTDRKLSGKSMSHSIATDDDELRYKYSILTETPVEDLSNLRLLLFMDQWYGTPYHYGGTSKSGIDCSAFSAILLSDVYNVNKIPRISADQYTASRRIPKKDLREGDLVFFHTLGKGHRVTHVGVYLYNDRFVHASIAGVQISNLAEGYYQQHYIGAGRIE